MSQNKKKTGFGLACWILVALVILIAFIVNKNRILSNLKDTGFFEKTVGSTPGFVQNHKSDAPAANSELGGENDIIKINISPDAEPVPETEEFSAENQNIADEGEVPSAFPELEKNTPGISAETPKPEESVQKVPENKTDRLSSGGKSAPQEIKKSGRENPPESKPIQYTDVNLCFVIIDSDGAVMRKMVTRSVPKNDSPLTNALKLLLAGPDSSNKAEKNCTTLIPDRTKLLGAKVQNGIAYLNFNENFEFNSVGAEGYKGQLMQIVYTATAFSTVNSVQFMIEGKKTDYLGSEGMWIGSPLSRSSF